MYRSFVKGLRNYSVDSINAGGRGIYAQATADIIFKRLMSNEEIRNSFLSGVVGQRVLSSIPVDLSLNAKSDYLNLRELLSDKPLIQFMNRLANTNRYKVIDSITNKEYTIGTVFVKKVAERFPELENAFPSEHRNITLDLLCKTSTELINVEVQVEPQNFWDIRILSHVCGLFHRQFRRGFDWNTLQASSNGSTKLDPIENKSRDFVKERKPQDDDEKVKHQTFRVIGVSIFDRPPIDTSKSPKLVSMVEEHVPWYNPAPWKRDELRRHYKLLDQNNPQLQRPGIEFLDYNLDALRRKDKKSLFTDKEVELQEWLDLFARAHLKTVDDIRNEVTLDPVKKAYELIKSTSLPDDIRAEYESNLEKRYNISHYISSEKYEAKEEGIQIGKEEGIQIGKEEGIQIGKKEGIQIGKEEGKEEGIKENRKDTAKNLLKLDISIDVIQQVTKLTNEEINDLRTISKSEPKPTKKSK